MSERREPPPFHNNSYTPFLWCFFFLMHKNAQTYHRNTPYNRCRIIVARSSQEYINRAARRVVQLVWGQFHSVIEALCVYARVCKCCFSLIKVTLDCALTESQAEQQRLEHNSLASGTHYLNDAIPHASVSTHLEMEQLHRLLRHSNVSPSYLPAARAQKGSPN